MSESLVVNASPVIFLSAVGRLDLLGSEAAPVVIPQRVVDEIVRFGFDNPAARALRET